MKKILSVWMLLVRSTFLRLLALWSVLIGAEGLLIARSLAGLPDHEAVSVEDALMVSHLGIACGAAFVLTVLILTLPDWQRGAKTAYTLRRLQISARCLYGCHAGYSAVCLLMFWALNALALAGLLNWLVPRSLPFLWGQQALMLVCYRTPLMHGFWPLSDWPLLVRNLSMLVLMGTLTGKSVLNTGGERPWSLLITSLLLIFLFPTGGNDWMLQGTIAVIALALAGIAVAGTLQKETDNEI